MAVNTSNSAYCVKYRAVECLKQMREWTSKELEETGETQLRNLFYFMLLGNPIGPYQVWVNTTQMPVYENVAVAALGV